jgi:hypothetical protein
MAGVLVAVPLVDSVIGSGAARADTPADTVVEASQDFCVHPAQWCTQPGQLGNLGYEEVAAVNDRGATFATPDHVVFVCARGYTAPDGSVHAISGHAFIGPSNQGFDGGTVRGWMFMAGQPTESTTSAFSAVDVRGYDPVMMTHASAVGWQVTNNVTDAPIVSDIDIRISGQLTDQVLTPTGPQTVKSFQGSISCDIHAAAAVVGAPPLGQPPDSEAVLSDSDSD